jgi:leucyl-tRNA synthetase
MVEGLLLVLAPFAPHFPEESWERLGTRAHFSTRAGEWDESLVVEHQV